MLFEYFEKSCIRIPLPHLLRYSEALCWRWLRAWLWSRSWRGLRGWFCYRFSSWFWLRFCSGFNISSGFSAWSASGLSFNMLRPWLSFCWSWTHTLISSFHLSGSLRGLLIGLPAPCAFFLAHMALLAGKVKAFLAICGVFTKGSAFLLAFAASRASTPCALAFLRGHKAILAGKISAGFHVRGVIAESIALLLAFAASWTPAHNINAPCHHFFYFSAFLRSHEAIITGKVYAHFGVLGIFAECIAFLLSLASSWPSRHYIYAPCNHSPYFCTFLGAHKLILAGKFNTSNCIFRRIAESIAGFLASAVARALPSGFFGHFIFLCGHHAMLICKL